MAKRDLTQFDSCTAGVGVNPVSVVGSDSFHLMILVISRMIFKRAESL